MKWRPIALLWTVLFAATLHAQEASKPNIILIMADDLGFEGLSVYGSASYKTPRLDALANNGMLFTSAYSQPLCTPSRVQIMTGRYNHRNYVNFGVLPPTEITFGHLLQDAGYKTGITGKWQLLGFDNKVAPSGGTGTHPRDAGFESFCLWQLDTPRKQGERYLNALISHNDGSLKRHEGKYGPDVFTNFALDFIEQNKNNPFFLYFPMCLVHDPFVPTPDSENWGADYKDKNTRYFTDMISYMDKIVGHIEDKLVSLGIAENTLLLFTGDNGTDRDITSKLTDGRTVPGQKGLPTEYGTHVPLIASWPGTIAPGTVNENLIDFSDFLPTFVHLAGAALPSDRVLDGQRFDWQLKGEPGTPRSWIFCDYAPRWGQWEPTRHVRNHRWKLYADGRMYDMQSDPMEESPLTKWDDESKQNKSTLQAALDRFAQEEANASQ